MNTHELIKQTAEDIMYGMVPYGVLKHVPQGFDLFYDLKKLKYNYYPELVFDVGANIGQTVLKWNKFFPKSLYYCFEPVSKTMQILKKNTSKLSNIVYQNCALGSESREEEITLFEDSRMNTLRHGEGDPVMLGKETIQIKTVDEICEDAGIERIDFMKIDTEGFDIEVLKGSSSLLKNKQITFIQVEAGMNPYNERHIPFSELVSFLQRYGYILFGIYGQHLEWNGEKRLRMSNPVFISNKAKF